MSRLPQTTERRIERVPIESIRITSRRRLDPGDIPALARNIEKHGLLHPIIVAADNELIAGERRWRACQSLGWTDIEIRRWGELTEAERREIELAENLDRKNLTPTERSRQMVRFAETAAQVLRDEADLLPDSGNKSRGRGRPVKPDSARAVSDRIGVPRQTLSDAKRHIAAIEAYPELTTHTQADSLKIAAKLTAMEEPERSETRAALKADDRDTLARLLDLRPMPKGPTIHEQAAKDAPAEELPVIDADTSEIAAKPDDADRGGADILAAATDESAVELSATDDAEAGSADADGRAELDGSRFMKRLNQSLDHLAQLNDESFDPKDVVTLADDETLRFIDSATTSAREWAAQVRAHLHLRARPQDDEDPR